MCALCSRAAKLMRAPWLGNMKDENAVSCCAHNLRLVGHDKTLQVTCNQHTNIQAPTTAACIKHKNYGRTSKVNMHNHNAALHHLTDPCSMRPLTSKEAIVLVQRHHAAPLASCASKQQFQGTRNLADKNDHARQN